MFVTPYLWLWKNNYVWSCWVSEVRYTMGSLVQDTLGWVGLGWVWLQFNKIHVKTWSSVQQYWKVEPSGKIFGSWEQNFSWKSELLLWINFQEGVISNKVACHSLFHMHPLALPLSTMSWMSLPKTKQTVAMYHGVELFHHLSVHFLHSPQVYIAFNPNIWGLDSLEQWATHVV